MHPAEEPCRLCGGRAVRKFSRTVLGRHEVGYFLCAGCGSLQTQWPHWLDEAYARHNLAISDTGAVLRNLESRAIVYTVARVLRLPANADVLDFGGGNGLLCRLLRDIGFDARFLEPHATNDFAQGFQVESIDSRHNVICSFEVFEHMAAPREAFATVFHGKPDVCVIGTATYRGQSSDWWYLAPESGQHVFFYSKEAMRHAGAVHGYSHESFGTVHLFTKRPLARDQRLILSRLLRMSGLKLVRMWLARKASYHWAVRDADRLAKQGVALDARDGDGPA